MAEQFRTAWAGACIYEYAEIDSTNLCAARLADQGAEHGTLIVAQSQTAGRGRRGRGWESPAGDNIYMSLILRPDFGAEKAPMLTLVMAYSVVQALEEAVCDRVKIKWPNDLVIGTKKICGILTEMKLLETAIDRVIIGVGINANVDTFPMEIRNTATSLKLETGKAADCSALIGRILEKFEANYDAFAVKQDLSDILEGYNHRLVNKDREVRILEPGNEYEAVARGINSAGELLVQKKNGELETVFSGEVSVRGIYDYV